MKKFISLMLVTLMMVTMVPQVLAEETTDPLATTSLLGYTHWFASTATYNSLSNNNGVLTTASEFTEMPEAKAFGTGVSNGTKEYAGDVTPSKVDLSVLKDGNYFTKSEVVMASYTGTTEKADGDDDKTKNFEPKDNTAKMLGISEGSGFEYNWTTAKNVARLHLWVYPANVIKEYEVYLKLSADGDYGQAPVKTGSLSYFTPDENEKNTTFNAVILDEIYTVYGIRFVVTELYGDVEKVYIAEAVPRATNEIDLVSLDPRNQSARVGKLITTSDVSQSIYVEDSVMGFYGGSSMTNGDFLYYQYAWPWSSSKKADSNFVLGEKFSLGSSTNGYQWHSKKGSAPDYNNIDAFYVADFGEAKQKINKIKMAVNSGAKNVTAIKLMCTNDTTTFNTQLSTEESLNDGWTTVERWTTGISTSFTSFTVANAPEARYWKVVAEIVDGGTEGVKSQLLPVAMFSIPENELAKTWWSGTVAAGEELTLNLDTYDADLASATEGTADVYFALYANDKLVSVSIAPDVALNSDENKPTYTVPASVPSGTLKVKAFIWSGDGSLQPLTTMPAAISQ